MFTNREIARFYSVRTDTDSRYDAWQHNDDDKDGNDANSWKVSVERGVFATARKTLRPPRRMADDATFVQVANLPDLYKVFERC